MTDDQLLSRITSNPEIFGGKPIIRGMRISVELILSLIAQSWTIIPNCNRTTFELASPMLMLLSLKTPWMP
jgi:hypothetical protein